MDTLSDNPKDNINILKKCLENINKAMSSKDESVLNDFTSNVTIGSLKYIKKALESKIEDAELLISKSDFEFTIAGPAVVDHSIRANVVSEIIDHIQHLRLSSAAFECGSLSSSGPYTTEILNICQMRIDAFLPSSFALRFSYDNKQVNESLLDDTRLGENLFFSLFSEQTDYLDLGDSLTFDRLRSHYEKLLSIITENNFTLTARSRIHPSRVKLSPAGARERKQLISYNQVSMDEKNTNITEIEIEGYLVMGNLNARTFLIENASGKYSGSVPDTGLVGLKTVSLGSFVKARLSVSNFNNISSKPNFTLLQLIAAPLYPVNNP